MTAVTDCLASSISVAVMPKIIDWLAELTAECPKKIAHNINYRCAEVSAIAEGAVAETTAQPPTGASTVTVSR